MAIRTLARLAPRHDYLRLVIVGPGNDDEDLRMQAAALDVLEDSLIIPRNSDDTGDLLGNARVDLRRLPLGVLAGHLLDQLHAEFCRRYLEDLGCRTPVFVVPHPPVESAAAIAGAGPAGAETRETTEA